MSDYPAYLSTLGLSSPMALEGFLEAAPDAIVVVDRPGTIVIVNQLAERLFGYSRQELLGMHIEGLVPQRFREEHARYRANYFQEITLSIECQTDVLIDSDRIAQMLSNLIGNAIQHGTQGPIEVTLHEKEPDAVVIEVHNFGPPIPKAEQPRLFEAFHRGMPGRRQRSSIGLGLFIAKEIVRAHGGSIVVRSPDRNGTTFSVVLPRSYVAA